MSETRDNARRARIPEGTPRPFVYASLSWFAALVGVGMALAGVMLDFIPLQVAGAALTVGAVAVFVVAVVVSMYKTARGHKMKPWR